MENKDKVLFKDLLFYTRDGEWGEAEIVEDSIPMKVIRGTDFKAIREGQLANVPIRFIQHKKALLKSLKAWDILIETAGGTKDQPTGRTAIITPKILENESLPLTCSSFARILRIKDEIVNPQYVFWFLQNIYNSGEIEAHQVQHTGIARFQFTRFSESVSLSLPSRVTQDSIVDILSSLDEKIELNRQMSKTLEDIASSLFKSWFIDFDPIKAKTADREPEGLSAEIAELFPDSFVDSPLGKIPSGWKIVYLHNVSNIVYGKNLPTSELIEDGFPVFGGNGLIGYYTTFLYDEPQVIIACRGAASGKIHRTIPKSFVTNNSLVCEILKNNDINRYYLEYMLKYLDMTRYATGSAQPQITIQNLNNVTFWIPKKELMIAFGKIISFLHEKELSLDINAKVLSEIRDTLLPKLINGEVKIREAETLISATI